MSRLRRRTVLAALGAAAMPPIVAVGAGTALAAEPESNTALYADPAVTEGVDYARRFRRHAALDDSDAPGGTYPDTAIIALHGGGIEPGTSELCLAIAGYHPAGGVVAGALYDYWMFEGIRSAGNAALHVTSAHCDDPVAMAMVAGSRRAVSLHGCTPTQAGQPENVAGVVVGGRDTALMAAMTRELQRRNIRTIDPAGAPELDGDHPGNIVNSTLGKAGVQLELTTPLRTAMFGDFTRAGRRSSTRQLFWDFVDAARRALAS